MSKKTHMDDLEDAVPISVDADNLFEAIGFETEEAAILNVKSQLYTQIITQIRERNLKQRQVSEILQTDQPRVSEIINGKLEKFTIDKLFEYAHRLKPTLRLEVQEDRRKQKKAASY
jgi:predicted XRE-type DNA-binding protein